jgi:hypothetical protein
VFIETGTDTGAGIVAALAAGYKQVISIDVDHGAVEYWNTRIIPSVPEVSVIEGDSVQQLKALLYSDVDWKTATFWLDAHDVRSTAILRELDLLAPIKDFRGVLMVDDMRLIRSAQEWAVGMKESDVTDKLKGWTLQYEASPFDALDILVAWRA